MSAESASVPAEGTARRLRFREAVTGLASRAQSTDLLRWIVIPGAVGIILGFNFMIFGWVGAARTFREIEQIPYLISGGLIGLALVFLGGLLLASAFWMVLLKKFQDEAEERSRRHTELLEARLADLRPSAPTSNGTTSSRPSRRSKAVSSSDA